MGRVEEGDGSAGFVGEEREVMGVEDLAVAREAEGVGGGAEDFGDELGVFAGGGEGDGAIQFEKGGGGDGEGV